MTTGLTPPVTTPRRSPPPPDGGDPWELVFAFQSRWMLLVAVPFVVAALSVLLTYLQRPTFTSTASFVAESRDRMPGTLGTFAGVATQLGLGGGAGTSSTSPQFYADLLRSREVMETVSLSRIPDRSTEAPNDSIEVKEAIATRWDRHPVRMDRAVNRLRELSNANVNPRTSVIELRVSAAHPTTAKEIGQLFLDVVDRFNLVRRQSQAGQRRKFAEARLAEAQDSLRLAEAAAQDFLARNAQFGSTRASPRLEFQYERYQRAVNAAQELVSTLRREVETARLDEVNDVPVINMIDAPNEPLTRSAPNRKTAALVGVMIGAFLAVLLVLVQYYADTLRAERPDVYRRFEGVLRRLRIAR